MKYKKAKFAQFKETDFIFSRNEEVPIVLRLEGIMKIPKNILDRKFSICVSFIQYFLYFSSEKKTPKNPWMKSFTDFTLVIYYFTKLSFEYPAKK